MLSISISISISISFSAIAQIPGLVPEQEWELNGYIQYRVNGYFVQGEHDVFDQSLQQRFNYEYRLNPDWRYNVGMRNRVTHGGSVKANDYADWFGRDTGYMDLSVNWMEEREVVGNSQFDRLYITSQQGDWLMRTGRFRVNWGMTTIWNPNDIFNVYSIYDTDYAERPGTDGILLGKKLGFASGVELVFSPAEEAAFNRYAARYYLNRKGWDVQFIAGKSEQDNVIGLGFAGSVSGAGIRGESSYFNPTEQEREGNLNHTIISSFETDYSFSSQRNWSIRAGVLHTADPSTPDNFTDYLTQPLSARTLSFSEFTGYAEVSFDLTPLNRSSFSSIYYQDGSLYFSYTNQYSLADNWQLTASIQRFDGVDSSVFGMTPTTMVYTMIRWDW
ncbi:hypothetical protein DI392_10595 [Vibrio albus]|uniref:Porin n=1 Tax=Vibrio albus TaxID=2200953 RepID=A0A2U3B9K6_9VIBR|nr:hypothetical protein DI392_10595 [Vibrio albus]